MNLGLGRYRRNSTKAAEARSQPSSNCAGGSDRQRAAQAQKRGRTQRDRLAGRTRTKRGAGEEKRMPFTNAQRRRGKRLCIVDRYSLAGGHQGALLIATGSSLVRFVGTLRHCTVWPATFATNGGALDVCGARVGRAAQVRHAARDQNHHKRQRHQMAKTQHHASHGTLGRSKDQELTGRKDSARPPALCGSIYPASERRAVRLTSFAIKFIKSVSERNGGHFPGFPGWPAYH